LPPPPKTVSWHGFARALDYAQVLSCPRIHVMAGLVPTGEARATLQATYESNVAWAAEMAATAGRDVLIEPINTRDIPGFFLNRQDEAHRIVQAIGAPNLKVQFDLYHCQIVEGDVASKIRQYLPTGRVGHFQIAGVPERHEPTVGELNYAYLFQVIDDVAQQCEQKLRRFVAFYNHPKNGPRRRCGGARLPAARRETGVAILRTADVQWHGHLRAGVGCGSRRQSVRRWALVRVVFLSGATTACQRSVQAGARIVSEIDQYRRF
jgi:hypothetical protein